MKIHPVFYVSLLQPASPKLDYLPSQQNLPPDPVLIDREPEYVIKGVEKIRFNKKRRQYKYLTR
jgi:hypothetical protein